MDKVLFPHKFAYVLSALTLPQASCVINRQFQAPAPPRVSISWSWLLLGAQCFCFVYLFLCLFFPCCNLISLSISLFPSFFLSITLSLSLFPSPHQLLGSILTPLSARAQTSQSRAALCHRDQKQLVSFLPVCGLVPSISLSK